MARHLPLPFTCQHEAYAPGVADAHGNVVPGWSAATTRQCVWWTPESGESPTPPAGGERVAVDAVLVVDSAVPVDHRDRFVLDGRRFEVVGLPNDYDHGPFGFSPGRRVVELKWVG